MPRMRLDALRTLCATLALALLSVAPAAGVPASPAELNPRLLDTTFITNLDTGFPGYATSVGLQADGKIVVGGVSAISGQTPGGLARLNADGSPDTDFNSALDSGADCCVTVAKVQKDGKILLGGTFTSINGSDVPDGLARLNADGSLDTSFNDGLGTGVGGEVKAIAQQADGKVLIGGDFTSLDLQDVPANLIRLNADGSLDKTFAGRLGTGFDYQVLALAVQSDGRILVGGDFATLNGADVADNLARITTGGLLDTAFNAALGDGLLGSVTALAVQTDGRVLAGGAFTTLNGSDVPDHLIRLSTYGPVDQAFADNLGWGLDGTAVTSVVVAADGKILIGGDFQTLNGDDVPDGLARLNSDGTTDALFTTKLGAGFDDGSSTASIAAIAIQPDGRILAAGHLSGLDGQSLPIGLVRIIAPVPSTTPRRPPTLTSTPSDGHLHLTWSAPTSDGGEDIIDYTVTVTGPTTADCTTDGLTADCDGVTNGRTYQISVAAVNSVGTGPAATLNAAPATVPGPVRSPAATPGNGTVTLSWSAPVSNGGNTITRYTATASPDATCTVSGAGARCSGLTNGTRYTFTIIAVNAAGPGEPATVSIRPRTIPDAPARAAVTFPAAGRAAVTWTAPARTGGAPITRYEYCISSCRAASNWKPTAVVRGRPTTTITLSSLRRRTLYTVTVRARNEAGVSATLTARFTQAR